jgi:single-stranded DNA-binding protein
MSNLSKVILKGQVVRTPEKRFTEDNLAITSFSLNFGTDQEEKIIRIYAFGNLALDTAERVKIGSVIIVEGKLATNTIKNESGAEKKVFEINAQKIESVSDSVKTVSSESPEKKESNFVPEDEIGPEDLIGEDEIPF